MIGLSNNQKVNMKEKLGEYGAILPCRGKGTRLIPLIGDLVPKSLYPVNGKELIIYTQKFYSMMQ